MKNIKLLITIFIIFSLFNYNNLIVESQSINNKDTHQPYMQLDTLQEKYTKIIKENLKLNKIIEEQTKDIDILKKQIIDLNNDIKNNYTENKFTKFIINAKTYLLLNGEKCPLENTVVKHSTTELPGDILQIKINLPHILDYQISEIDKYIQINGCNKEQFDIIYDNQTAIINFYRLEKNKNLNINISKNLDDLFLNNIEEDLNFNIKLVNPIVDINHPLYLVSKGKIDNNKFYIGQKLEDIVNLLGEPKEKGYIAGGFYIDYDGVSFYGGSFNEEYYGVVIDITFYDNQEIFGIKIGDLPITVKNKFGIPTKEFYNSDIDDELNYNKWQIIYELGNFRLVFNSVDSNSPINNIHLQINRHF